MTKRLLAVFISVTGVMIGSAGAAFAAPTSLDHTGQGTNDDGTCASFEGDAEADEQVWQFNLTGQSNPEDATMDAEFDDGTSVSGLEPGATPGQVAHFFVTTEEGAALTSATAFFDSEQAGNPQFTVSHCSTGESDGNGDDDDNGENGNGEDGEPVAVPTDVPAGVTSPDGGSSAPVGALLGGFALVAATGGLIRRRVGAGE